jgi:hypothetical protein
LYLWQFTKVAFTWYVVLGSIATFIVGYAASLLLPPLREPNQQPQFQDPIGSSR